MRIAIIMLLVATEMLVVGGLSLILLANTIGMLDCMAEAEDIPHIAVIIESTISIALIILSWVIYYTLEHGDNFLKLKK